MRTSGRHLIAEFYRCDGSLLDDTEEMRRLMLEAAEVVGASVLGDTFPRFSPQGVSGTVVIAESHLSVHTWPEYGYVAVDIYTCGGLDPRPGFEHLGRSLGAGECRMQEILRGLPEDLEDHRQLLPEDVRIITRMTSERRIGDAITQAAGDRGC
ncbi:MAG: adenosylmethionine decarboxylase [Planctomycetota bacterium]